MTRVATKEQLFLKALLEEYHPGRGDELLTGLASKDEETALREMGAPLSSPKYLLIDSEKALRHIHYSWIKEALTHFSKPLIPLLIGVLSKKQQEGLALLLGMDQEKTPSPLPPIKPFLAKKLYLKMDRAKEVLPIEFLPEYPLTPLLTLEKNYLLELFDLLGLYDLATKIKEIVDQKTLSMIDKSLSPIRKRLLNIFMQQHDKSDLPCIDLRNWNGDPKILKKLLHRRGLQRITHALAGYHPDFIWHFCHRLDTGRGKIVTRSFLQEETHLTPILTEQVLFIMNILTKKSAS